MDRNFVFHTCGIAAHQTDNDVWNCQACTTTVGRIRVPDDQPPMRDKVAAMTIDGWTPTMIARYLGISKLTVMDHLERIAARTPPDFDVTGVPV